MAGREAGTQTKDGMTWYERIGGWRRWWSPPWSWPAPAKATTPTARSDIDDASGGDIESGPPEVDACALGAATITDIFPYGRPRLSSGGSDGYDCLWSGENPRVYTSFEVSVAMWDAGSYSTLDEMRVQFETDMTTFRPVDDLGEEGWFQDSFAGNQVSWRTADFTVSLGGGHPVTGIGDEAYARVGVNGDLEVSWHDGTYVVEVEMLDATVDVTEEQLLDLAYGIDADLPE